MRVSTPEASRARHLGTETSNAIIAKLKQTHTIVDSAEVSQREARGYDGATGALTEKCTMLEALLRSAHAA